MSKEKEIGQFCHAVLREIAPEIARMIAKHGSVESPSDFVNVASNIGVNLAFSTFIGVHKDYGQIDDDDMVDALNSMSKHIKDTADNYFKNAVKDKVWK